jgi:hypothetical protein
MCRHDVPHLNQPSAFACVLVDDKYSLPIDSSVVAQPICGTRLGSRCCLVAGKNVNN